MTGDYVKHRVLARNLIFLGLVLMCIRTFYGLGHGDRIWVLYLIISIFFARVVYESYIYENNNNQLYLVQAYGFFALAAILFCDIFISSQQSNVILICYLIIYIAMLIRSGGIAVIKKKFGKK